MPPKLDDELKRVHVMMQLSLIARINAWRRHQQDPPNLSDAVRQLLDIALEAEKKAGKR